MFLYNHSIDYKLVSFPWLDLRHFFHFPLGSANEHYSWPSASSDCRSRKKWWKLQQPEQDGWDSMFTHIYLASLAGIRILDWEVLKAIHSQQKIKRMTHSANGHHAYLGVSKSEDTCSATAIRSARLRTALWLSGYLLAWNDLQDERL